MGLVTAVIPPSRRHRLQILFLPPLDNAASGAVGSDGPAWYAARDAMSALKKSDPYGTAFVGFGETVDQVSSALAGLLTYQWHRLRDSQRDTIAALRHAEHERAEVADRFGITQQGLSNRMRSSGLREYVSGLNAMRCLLRNPVGKKK